MKKCRNISVAHFLSDEIFRTILPTEILPSDERKFRFQFIIRAVGP